MTSQLVHETRSIAGAASRSASAAVQPFGAQSEGAGEVSPAAGFRAAFSGPRVLVTDAGDASERAADQIAARVAAPAAAASPNRAPVPLPRAELHAGGNAVERNVARAIVHARGGDRSLLPPVRARMEQALGADLGAVRIHTDATADALNRSLNARAFTTGNDVFFRQSAYEPQSGTGRDLLAHELWHVIQQRRAARSDTVFVQRRLMVTDSRGTRGVPDLANTTNRRDSTTTPDPDTNTPQREPADTDAPAPPSEDRTVKGLRESIKAALEEDASSAAVIDDPERMRNVLDNEALDAWIDEILTGPVDYGSIDLADPKKLALMYFVLRRWDETPALFDEDVAESKALLKEGQAEKAKLDDYKQRVQLAANKAIGIPNSPPVRVYKLAVLGRGASVAFYFDTNRGKYDVHDTIVIGKEQPWRLTRGPQGNVNQPSNLVAPQSAQNANPYGGGLAKRQELSDQIDNIINAAVPPEAQFNEAIQSVTKKTSADPAVSYYLIHTDRRTFYVQNVIAGLGIGGHKAPSDRRQWEQLSRAPQNELQNVPRIMDMDTFQRLVADTENPKLREDAVKKIVVVGPNAAIDVMTTALRRGYDNIFWVTKTNDHPAFLPGTDNTYVKRVYHSVLANPIVDPNEAEHKKYSYAGVTVLQHDYLGASVDHTGVTVRYGSRADDRGPHPKPEKTMGEIHGDIMVYGLGPDLEPLKKIFGTSLENVTPVYDVNRRFNVDPAALTPLKVEVSLLDLFDSFVIAEAGTILDGVARFSDIKKIPLERGLKTNPSQKLPHEPLPNTLPAVIGLREKTALGDQTSLQFIGGAAFRLLDDAKLNYTYVSENIDELLTSGMEELRRRLLVIEPILVADNAFGGAARAFLDELATYLQSVRALASRVERGGLPTESWVDLQRASVGLKGLPLARVLKSYLEVSGKLKTETSKRLLRGAFSRARKLPDELIELSRSGRRAAKSNPRAQPYLAADRMRAVPYSLPKNILLNDQLTPSRSEIEAAHGFMPEHVARGVDFVSADATIVADHIAEKYQNLPPALANYVTARIVYDRRHLAEKDAPLPRPDARRPPTSGEFTLERLAAFQNLWVDKLARLDAVFAKAKRKDRRRAN